MVEQESSPIDAYLDHVGHVLTLGEPSALQSSATLGRLLILGLLAGVETYFRSIFAGMLRLCPECRLAAAAQALPFGSIEYYGQGNAGYGLFERTSLTTMEEIRSQCRKV